MDITPERIKDTLYGTMYLRSDTAVKKSDLCKVVEDMEREAIEQRKTRHVRTAEKIEKWIAELKATKG